MAIRQGDKNVRVLYIPLDVAQKNTPLWTLMLLPLIAAPQLDRASHWANAGKVQERRRRRNVFCMR